jgi:hypothetical protein
MTDLSFATHLCTSQKEYEATAAGIQAMLEGLGNNILKHLGNVELGKSLRIFLQDAQGQIVGGIAGELFGVLDDYPAGHQKYFLQKMLIGG